MLQCPECRRIIMEQCTEGGCKIRTRMVLFDEEGNGSAICPSCKTPVPVPIQLGDISCILPKQKVFLNVT